MKSVVLLSGGVDSTTLLYYLLQRGEVKALSVNYGQRHLKELACAGKICRKAGVGLHIIDLTSLTSFLSGSALTSPEIAVPEGHYTEESMRATIVPNRNMILLSVAIGWAISLKYDQVAYAAHVGDHSVYPDTRPEFADKIAEIAMIADWHPIELARPFINMTKADIVKLGSQLEVPYALTYSCYKGGEESCGKCGTCTERKEAFRLAGVEDPIKYEGVEDA